MKKSQTSKIACVAKFWLLLLFLAPPVMTQAQYTFTTNSDGSLNIAQYTGSGGAVIIPNTTNGLPITSIGDAAFFNNSTLTSVTVGTNVAIIADQAFSYSSMTNVTLPDSVTNIAFDSFLDCNSLTAITVATNNPDFSSAAGVLFNQNQTTLIGFPEGKAGSYAVPDTVTNIGVYAFYDAANLTSVALSTNVSNIATYAFYDCPGLTSDNGEYKQSHVQQCGGCFIRQEPGYADPISRGQRRDLLYHAQHGHEHRDGGILSAVPT